MEKETLNNILLGIMDVYNEDLPNDKKHQVLSDLWTKYYKLSEKTGIKLDFAYQLYLIGESESYIINEEPERFVVDKDELNIAINHLEEENGLTIDEIETLLQASVENARSNFANLGMDVKTNSLNGFCELGQALTLMPLENLGLKVTKNSAKESFDYPFNHVFGTVTFPYQSANGTEEKTYLIDSTYRQFFTTNRCNEGRYYQEEENTGLKVAPDPGYFMEDETFARNLMRNGYVPLTKETATKYGEAFYKASIPLGKQENLNNSKINYYENIINSNEDYKVDKEELEGLNLKFRDSNKTMK